jgi:hypothetical protein
VVQRNLRPAEFVLMKLMIVGLEVCQLYNCSKQPNKYQVVAVKPVLL